MRLFKYTVDTYVPDTENMCNYSTKGHIIITDDNLDEESIKKIIIDKLFHGDENCTVDEIEQVPVY